MDNVIALKQKSKKYDVTADSDAKAILNYFEENFQMGEKTIAFSSGNYKNSQERCIMLAADYFNKKYPSLKIAIVSFNLDDGLFQPFKNESKDVSDGLHKFMHNLYFLDWNKIINNDPQDIVDEYDMVLWDLPDLDSLHKKKESLEPFFTLMDALYIVSLRFENFDDESFKRNVFSVYKDHGMDIKSILPWKIGSKRNKRRNFIKEYLLKLLRK